MAVRCMHEASLYTDNSFITLTYDDDHLPSRPYNCDRCEDPHIIKGSVCVSQFQDFMKRLRKYYGSSKENPIRFFHCGEYGQVCEICGLSKIYHRVDVGHHFIPVLGRPHYHSIMFNLKIEDKKLHSVSNGNNLYVSDDIQRIWGLGNCIIGDVSFESAGYVARYSLKKVHGERKENHYKGRKPEYTTMSRRPGIGAGWYEKFKSDVYPRDGVIIRGRTTRPPRFYDSLLGREDPALLAKLKINREITGQHYVDDVLSDGRIIKVSDSDGKRLLVKEEVKLAQIEFLKRPMEGL